MSSSPRAAIVVLIAIASFSLKSRQIVRFVALRSESATNEKLEAPPMSWTSSMGRS
jgi:hypothetical protein